MQVGSIAGVHNSRLVTRSPVYYGWIVLAVGTIGAINGVSSTLMVASSALGPMPFGIARDLMSSYTLILTGFAALPFVLAFANLFYARPPVRSQG